ncbi:hypothetical protein [Christiangramia forsetii]|uniref:Uncharacterized protein n=1 Tax=Christiangramia forsetii TaxID=411153 RepID=A0ABQ1WFY2_9FLAO|nr:hypothetical protein [Christiangramia forsetii]GGG29831.1 hypothetical protein GCM10011532_11590 [Christiangramia forsetii]
MESNAENKLREGWEEMIKKEIETSGQPEKLIPDFFEDEETDECND